MMKIIKKYSIFLFFIFLFSACNNKNNDDLTIRKEFLTAPFTQIIVNEGIALFVIESTEQKVVIETEEDLFNGIDLNISNNQLEVSNINNSSFFNDFNTIKVYVYSTNITKIRNSSTYPVSSIGVLNFDSLVLISEDYLSDYLNYGDFNLELNSKNVTIIANGPSNHYLKGSCNNININFAGSHPRFEGEDFLVKNATLFARSTNDILIKVSEKISGDLYSTGDVILFKEPTIIDLRAHFSGKVISRY